MDGTTDLMHITLSKFRELVMDREALHAAIHGITKSRIPWVGNILWSRKWQPTPVFLTGKSHGQSSLEGYSPWNHKRVGQLSNNNNKDELNIMMPNLLPVHFYF